jgi:hypothetical protein
MSAARGVLVVALVGSWPVFGCPSARPAETGGVHQTFEIADVGLYTGEWPGREADGTAGEADVAEPEGVTALGTELTGVDDSAAARGCGPGLVCGLSELGDVNCGGARRPLNPPVPDAGRGLAVRAGEVNDPAVPIAASTRTDDQGRFTLELDAGTWCIIEEAKADESSLAAWESAGAASSCLESWARLCDAVVRVGREPTPEVQLFFQRHCGAGPCFPAPPYP